VCLVEEMTFYLSSLGQSVWGRFQCREVILDGLMREGIRLQNTKWVLSRRQPPPFKCRMEHLDAGRRGWARIAAVTFLSAAKFRREYELVELPNRSLYKGVRQTKKNLSLHICASCQEADSLGQTIEAERLRAF